jgi:hypothetical protein
MPCKECFHQLISTRFLDLDCVYCGGAVSEEYFVWSCPLKLEIWQTIMSRVFIHPAKLTYILIQYLSSFSTEVTPSLSVTSLKVIACVLLSMATPLESYPLKIIIFGLRK